MDMEQIECFLAVSKYSSFSKASYEVSISQSSISKKISNLEKELGVPLFERSTRTVKLTKTGQLLFEYGEKLLQTYHDFMNEVIKDNTILKSKLIIGSIYLSQGASFIPLMAQFSKMHPEIELDTVENTTVPLVKALLDSTIDVAFVSSIYSSTYDDTVPNFSQDDRFISHTISKDPYYFVVSNKHPFANRTCVDYQDIKDEKFIGINKETDVYHKAFIKVFESENIIPNIVARSSTAHDALIMVLNNIGVAFLSPQVVSGCQGIAIIPVKRPIIKELQIIIRNEKVIPPNIKKFFNFIKNTFE